MKKIKLILIIIIRVLIGVLKWFLDHSSGIRVFYYALLKIENDLKKQIKK